MSTRQVDDLQRRSALRLLVPPLIFLGVLGAAVAVRISGDVGTARLVFNGGVAFIAIWALVDGGQRALGRSTFLGTGRGIDRLIGLVQAVTTIGLVIALLPNAVALLNYVARVAVRGG